MATGPVNPKPWETYPYNNPLSMFDIDQKGRREIFRSESARLFSGHDNVDIWTIHPASGLKKEKLDWGTYDSNLDTCAHFVHQRSSWGYLQITKESLQRILYLHRIPSVVLDAVFAFGVKTTNEDDPYFSICYNRLSSDSDAPGAAANVRCLDIIYILRRFEKHGRADLKHAWSLRQMMVCHKQNLTEKKNIWLFFQSFQDCKDEFSKRFQSKQHPLSMHALLLTMSLSTWRWYLNDLRSDVAGYMEKAIRSSLAVKQIDYDTGFTDSQRLETICTSLRQASAILQSTLDIAKSIQRQCETLEALGICEPGRNENLLQSIAYDIGRSEIFQRAASALLKEAKQASHLLLQLLYFRKADVQNSHSEALRNLAASSNSQNEGLRLLNERMQQDSRSVKLLTTVAMAFLPASLLAGIFSTNLIYVPQVTDPNDSRTIVVHKAMWIYVLSSLVLSAGTLGAFLVWDRRGP